MSIPLAQRYLSDLNKIMLRLRLDHLETIILTLMNAYEKRHTIFIMGNGGSASTASHFSCDINKGTSPGLKKRMKVICLNDNMPTILAYANDRAYSDIFVEQLKNFLKSEDVVIGISASGNSKNIIKAIQYANKHSAISVAFTGFDGGILAKIAGTSMIVPSNDMQQIEDMHLILVHIIMQVISKKLRKEDGR